MRKMSIMRTSRVRGGGSQAPPPTIHSSAARSAWFVTSGWITRRAPYQGGADTVFSRVDRQVFARGRERRLRFSFRRMGMRRYTVLDGGRAGGQPEDLVVADGRSVSMQTLFRLNATCWS